MSGATVKQGDILATLDVQDYQNKLRSAEADVAAAEAALVEAQPPKRRLGKLLKNGWTPKANYDTALHNLRAAEAKLAAAKASLALTRDQLNYTELKAEFDGVITAVGAEAGQNVTSGQMVVKLARLTDKDGVFNIAETALVDHRNEGAEVIVWPLSNPQLTIEGVVREISPVADATTRTYTVKVTLKDPPPSIRFGMSVGGRWKGSPALFVALPLSALFEKNGAPAVWVFDRAIRQRHAEAGHRRALRGRHRRHRQRPCQGRHRHHRRHQHAARRSEGAPCRRRSTREEQPMKNFNLSRWAIEHKSLVVYFMLVIALAGMLEYGKLGREEDPPFTIKTMVVKTLWPGATTLETVKQVTDRIEKKLEELPNLDYLKSYTKPGESVVFVNLKDSTRASEVPDLWYQVRKKVGDIKQTLPRGGAGAVLQ